MAYPTALLAVLSGVTEGVAKGLENRQKYNQADRELELKEQDLEIKRGSEKSKELYYKKMIELLPSKEEAADAKLKQTKATTDLRRQQIAASKAQQDYRASQEAKSSQTEYEKAQKELSKKKANYNSLVESGTRSDDPYFVQAKEELDKAQEAVTMRKIARDKAARGAGVEHPEFLETMNAPQILSPDTLNALEVIKAAPDYGSFLQRAMENDRYFRGNPEAIKLLNQERYRRKNLPMMLQSGGGMTDVPTPPGFVADEE